MSLLPVPPRRAMSSQSGFTLIEILVALLITLVGLAGAAGLATRSIKQEVESYQRVQALTLLQDMVDRLNANRGVAACYVDATPFGGARDIGAGGDEILTCGAGTTAPEIRAKQDLTEWHNALIGSSEESGGRNIGAMIGARGCVGVVNPVDQSYRITVAWQGVLASAAPTDANICGKDSYGDETFRRIVSAVVRIGDLK